MKSLCNTILESLDNINESVTDEIIVALQNNNGMVERINDDSMLYFCKILNDNNFDFSFAEKLKSQLKKEGLFNRAYASGMVFKDSLINGKIPAQLLPVYGRGDKFETKWFSTSMKDCVSHDVRDLKLSNKLKLK